MADSALAQFIAAIQEGAKEIKLRELYDQLSSQDKNFIRAMGEIEDIREFIGSPQHILGSLDTKHGEIAEHVQVGIKNARSFLLGGERVASKHPDRLGGSDYLDEGIQVQSKFINGETGNNSLRAVLDHLDKYPEFSTEGYGYHIPKDQFETIQSILKGENPSNYNETSIRAVIVKVRELEVITNKPFDEIVKPSISEYSEVQQGKIHSTLDNHEENLGRENENIKEQMLKGGELSFHDAIQLAGTSILLGAGFQLTLEIYSKYREGKNIFLGGFDSEDWKALGLKGLNGGTKGAVMGGGIYLLTTYADLCAPLAGACVNSIIRVNSLLNMYRRGEIFEDEFLRLGAISCIDSAAVAIGASAGQVLIPVPILGSVLGAIATNYFMSIVKHSIVEHRGLVRKLETQFDQTVRLVNKEYQDFISGISTYLEDLDALINWSFNYEKNLNLALLASTNLARAIGVQEEEIITSEDEVDEFMRKRVS